MAALAAQIPSEEIGSGYVQETHPQELFRECSVDVEQISHPEQMPRILRIAVRGAVEKRAVAVLVLPDASDPQQAAEVLNGCDRVTILAGAGCAGAHDELLQIAEHLKAPIVHAMGGKEHVAYDDPYDGGMTGLLGTPPGTGP